MKCLECGHDLIETNRYPTGFIPSKNVGGVNYWSWSHTEYEGHCENCKRNWEWDEYLDGGKVRISPPRQIIKAGLPS